MNLDQLKCFVKVATTLNFSRSAKELHLSQPTISRTISALEEETGVKLLDRSAKQITLTKEGAFLLEHCKRQIQMWETAVKEVRCMQSTRQELTVGMLGFSEEHLLEALRRLEKRHSHMQLHLVPIDFIHGFEDIASGKVDCFMFWSECIPEDVAFLPLCEKPAMIYLNRHNALAGKPCITLNELSQNSNIVFDSGEETMHRQRFPKSVGDTLRIIKVKDFMTSRRLLELDKGVVLAPEGTFQNESDDITGIPLADYEEKICLGLCYRRENRNPLLLELLGYLKNE